MFASFYEGALYYSGNYRANTALTHPFFSRLLEDAPSRGEERFSVIFNSRNFADSNADYALFENESLKFHQKPESLGYSLCAQQNFNPQELGPAAVLYAKNPRFCAVFWGLDSFGG